MACGKHSARLEEWLTDFRVLLLWPFEAGNHVNLN
jgi:hypothetical protein